MERSEGKRLSHKHNQNQKTRIKNNIKVNPVIEKRTTIENIPQQQTLNVNNNNKISIVQNLPLQDSSSNYQMQPQINMFPQQYAQPVIISNQGGINPQNPYVNNQNCINNINNVNIITFGREPDIYLCPNCQMNVPTNIATKCNCCSFLIFALMMIIFPIFVIYVVCIDIEYCKCGFECACAVSSEGVPCPYPKCCSCPDRHSACDCCDVEHYCSNCGKLIGTRDSCKEICPPCCRCC